MQYTKTCRKISRTKIWETLMFGVNNEKTMGLQKTNFKHCIPHKMLV